jgi:hypothetical protein
MVKIPVDECPAGTVMDAAVAKALSHLVFCQLDFDRWFIASDRDAFQQGLMNGLFWEGGGGREPRYCLDMPNYSADIAAAWKLFSYLCKEWFCVKSIFIKDLRIKVNLYRDSKALLYADPTITAIAQYAPLAITRAFLKANGVEYIEVPD